MLSGGVSCAQSRADRQLQFDLSKIGMVMDNRQICEDKGGLQDYPSKVMDQVIAAGPKSVPILIAMLSDERIAPTQEPIICFWQDMTIGDIAFCVLTDLFLNADWTETTIPGAGWNEMLGADDNLPRWGSAELVHCEAREKSPSR